MSVRPFTDKQGRARFVVDYYENGRKGPRVQRVLPEFVNTRELAEEWERAAVYKEADIVPSPEDAGRTVAEIFPKFLSFYQIHREPTSYRDLESTWRNHFKPLLGHIRVDRISLEHIELYKRLRKGGKGRDRKSPVSNRTINKELSLLSGFISWAEEGGITKQRQFRIRALKYRRPKPIVLTPAEAMAILRAAEPVYRVFFMALFLLGLRFAEAQRLEWEKIDYGAGIFKVKQKGGSEKILPLLPFFRQALDAIRPQKPHGHVFKSRRTGGPIIDVRKALRRAAKKAGVKKHVNPHLFRHSIGTWLMGRGIHQKIIQAWLGHLDQATTQFYEHVSIEHLQPAADIIEAEITTITPTELLPEKCHETSDYSI